MLVVCVVAMADEGVDGDGSECGTLLLLYFPLLPYVLFLLIRKGSL